jgi:acyl-CoA thioester hydrolase
MCFTLEAHITYDQEVKLGDPLRITSQILDWDAKRIHFFHQMYHAEQGYLAATNEQIMLHVGYHTRRSAPWADEVGQRIAIMGNVHRTLPRPPQVGRVIGLQRK